MKTNTRMAQALALLPPESPLETPLATILKAGFVDNSDCTFFAAHVGRLANAQRSDFEDATAFECFICCVH